MSRDLRGLRRPFYQFSSPGRDPQPRGPWNPGATHGGRELRHSVAHAYGEGLGNPALPLLCVIGDGEAEAGPPATSWRSNKPLDPRRVGAVVPVPHLNGHQIASPSLLARMQPSVPPEFRCGNVQPPIFVRGEEGEAIHRLGPLATDQALRETRGIQAWPGKGRPRPGRSGPPWYRSPPRTCAGCWHAREPGTSG